MSLRYLIIVTCFLTSNAGYALPDHNCASSSLNLEERKALDRAIMRSHPEGMVAPEYANIMVRRCNDNRPIVVWPLLKPFYTSGNYNKHYFGACERAEHTYKCKWQINRTLIRPEIDGLIDLAGDITHEQANEVVDYIASLDAKITFTTGQESIAQSIGNLRSIHGRDLGFTYLFGVGFQSSGCGSWSVQIVKEFDRGIGKLRIDDTYMITC